MTATSTSPYRRVAEAVWIVTPTLIDKDRIAGKTPGSF